MAASGVQWASQPLAALIQRRASRLIQGARRLGSQGSLERGSLTMLQRYCPVASAQSSATQGPRVRRLMIMPSGQGSAAQQIPQPLQAWPGAGLGGAEGCRRTICHSAERFLSVISREFAEKHSVLSANQRGCWCVIRPDKSSYIGATVPNVTIQFLLCPLAGFRDKQQGGSQSAYR